MSNILKLWATLGPVGYLPAPGTMGTLVALPLAGAISVLSLNHQGILISMICILSLYTIAKVLPFFSVADPSEIILDELVGCLITFYGITYTLPSWIFGFILFRLFDIFKPAGIQYIEKLPGAYGILLDDCCAGLFANLILRYFIL